MFNSKLLPALFCLAFATQANAFWGNYEPKYDNVITAKNSVWMYYGSDDHINIHCKDFLLAGYDHISKVVVEASVTQWKEDFKKMGVDSKTLKDWGNDRKESLREDMMEGRGKCLAWVKGSAVRIVKGHKGESLKVNFWTEAFDHYEMMYFQSKNHLEGIHAAIDDSEYFANLYARAYKRELRKINDFTKMVNIKLRIAGHPSRLPENIKSF